MIRFFVRLVALALLAGAFAAAVIDGARSIAANQLSLTPLGATLYWAFPKKFPLMQTFIETQINPLVLKLLWLPTWAAFAVIGAGLFYLVRRRPPPIGYSSRSR